MSYRRQSRTRRPILAHGAMAPMAAESAVMRFDSWGDYVTRAEMPESTPVMGAASHLVDSFHTAEWCGTQTFEDAAKLARDGWADGASRLSELTARLEGKIGNVSAVRHIAYAMSGPGVLDMGRYLMGHPEPYMVWRESEELQDINPERIVRIVVNAGANSNLSSQRIWWRGAAACAITDLIESTGARVEIELVRKNRSQGMHTRRILAKRAQDHVAPEILAFALAHNASHRRIDFAVRETLPTATRRAIGAHASGGYGTSIELDQDEYQGAIYVPYDAYEFSGPEGTANWVVKTLAAHGIEVETT